MDLQPLLDSSDSESTVGRRTPQQETDDPISSLTEDLSSASMGENTLMAALEHLRSGVRDGNTEGNYMSTLRHGALIGIHKIVERAKMHSEPNWVYAFMFHLGLKASQGLGHWSVDNQTPQQLVEALAIVSHAIESLGGGTQEEIRASQEALKEIILGVGGQQLCDQVRDWQNRRETKCQIWVNTMVRKTREREGPPINLQNLDSHVQRIPRMFNEAFDWDIDGFEGDPMLYDSSP